MALLPAAQGHGQPPAGGSSACGQKTQETANAFSGGILPMKVLVTGGAGYIGSHTCKELALQGHEVIVYDNLSTGHRELVRWGGFCHGDIRDTQALRACLRRERPDGVIHFAACAYVGESVTDPGKYFSNNVGGTLSILQAMRDEDVRNIVVSSTCAVYGQPDRIPISEDTPTSPINPYGASKLFMERMLADFHNAHGLNWMALRYFNAAGCDPQAETGEWHEPETHLIPLVLNAAVGDSDQLAIFGNDYPTPDGTCIRDYVHVKDLATAHLAAMQQLLRGADSCSLNLGTGSGCSIMDIVRHVEKVSGKQVRYVIRDRRPGDPAKLVADNTAATRKLSWEPRNSGMEYIIETALNYLMAHRRR